MSTHCGRTKHDRFLLGQFEGQFPVANNDNVVSAVCHFVSLFTMAIDDQIDVC